MNKLTYCIPSKNNLRYLKSSINSIKNNSATEHDIIVYVDADNDGTEDWLKLNGVKYLLNESNTPRGLAYGYNRCIEAATTDIVCMFHADMYMAKGFDIAILKHLKPGVVVSGTRIEPPLHPQGLEKVVADFGMYPEDFKKDAFDQYVEELVQTNAEKVTAGIFAPWAVYKDEIVSIRMHDESFHSYHEDSDIFNRFILNGYKMVQTWEAYVYHLTCRGGQFQDGIEKVTTDSQFHKMKDTSAKKYLRKWGSWIKNDSYQHPIIPPKFDIGFIVKNCSPQLLATLELFCSTISSDASYAEYIKQEQPNTKFDLMKRIKPWNAPMCNDILVDFDANQLNGDNFALLQQLPDIIAESGEEGEFELDIFRIKIRSLTRYESQLVNLDSKYYTNQLL